MLINSVSNVHSSPTITNNTISHQANTLSDTPKTVSTCDDTVQISDKAYQALNDSMDTSSSGLKALYDRINNDPKFANEMAKAYADSIDLKKIPLVNGHLPLPTDGEAWTKLTRGQQEFELQADTVREQRIQIYNNMKASGASGAEIYKKLMAFNKTLPEDYLSNSGTDRFLKYL